MCRIRESRTLLLYPFSSPLSRVQPYLVHWVQHFMNWSLLEGDRVHDVNVIYYWRVKGQPLPGRVLFSSGYQDT